MNAQSMPGCLAAYVSAPRYDARTIHMLVLAFLRQLQELQKSD